MFMQVELKRQRIEQKKSGAEAPLE